MTTLKTPSKKSVYKPSTKQHKDALWEKERYTYAWQPEIDYRKYPDQYKVGKGEQGVLICQPYKSEIGPHWHFKDPEIATESSEKIYEFFLQYLKDKDFVGADMARKYLQMGYTRARRYANHKGGRKYDIKTGQELPKVIEDPVKAASARIFYAKWKEAEAEPLYKEMKVHWKTQYG